jgi:hypothetical protein
VIVNERPLGPADIAALVAFTSTILVRSPKFRDHMQQPWAEIVKMVDEFAAAQAAMTPEQKRAQPPPIRPITGGTPVSIEAARAAAERPLPTLLGPYVRAHSDTLRKMGYVLLHTKEKPGFITSDKPMRRGGPRRPSATTAYAQWPDVAQRRGDAADIA